VDKLFFSGKPGIYYGEAPKISFVMRSSYHFLSWETFPAY